jgi:hypothetical protein
MVSRATKLMWGVKSHLFQVICILDTDLSMSVFSEMHALFAAKRNENVAVSSNVLHNHKKIGKHRLLNLHFKNVNCSPWYL